ncbi:hypothetical protein PAPYR_3911 [Paratrimastix pyriformis]|uniref:Uncharacterized protein n=1 Tax=Paratrimastix pyriformis TaxID=342808 RepID=A0ABQ8UR75_9EUKA|nr:hypothetical protein PAPYR_3911 [Paratrimastix pyriformis]
MAAAGGFSFSSLPLEILLLISETSFCSAQAYTLIIASDHPTRCRLRGRIHSLSFADGEEDEDEENEAHLPIISAESAAALIGSCPELQSLQIIISSPRKQTISVRAALQFSRQRAMIGCGRDQATYTRWIDAAFPARRQRPLRVLRVPCVRGLPEGAFCHLLAQAGSGLEVLEVDTRLSVPLYGDRLLSAIGRCCPGLVELRLGVMGQLDYGQLGPCTLLRRLGVNHDPLGTLDGLLAGLPGIEELALDEVWGLRLPGFLGQGRPALRRLSIPRLLGDCGPLALHRGLESLSMRIPTEQAGALALAGALAGWRQTLRHLALGGCQAPGPELLEAIAGLAALRSLDLPTDGWTCLPATLVALCGRLEQVGLSAEPAAGPVEGTTLTLPRACDVRLDFELTGTWTIAGPQMEILRLPRSNGSCGGTGPLHIRLETPLLQRIEGLHPLCTLTLLAPMPALGDLSCAGPAVLAPLCAELCASVRVVEHLFCPTLALLADLVAGRLAPRIAVLWGIQTAERFPTAYRLVAAPGLSILYMDCVDEFEARVERLDLAAPGLTKLRFRCNQIATLGLAECPRLARLYLSAGAHACDLVTSPEAPLRAVDTTRCPLLTRGSLLGLLAAHRETLREVRLTAANVARYWDELAEALGRLARLRTLQVVDFRAPSAWLASPVLAVLDLAAGWVPERDGQQVALRLACPRLEELALEDSVDIIGGHPWPYLVAAPERVLATDTAG